MSSLYEAGSGSRVRSTACLLLFGLLTALPLYADEWKTVFDDGDVTVQQRPYGTSPLMELRGQTRVQATLNAVMALLKDADYNKQWVFRSGGANILQASGYAQAYVHGIIDAPWPMEDRDSIVRFDYVQHPQTRFITISIINFPDFMPPQQGFVRVPDFGGFWQLTPQASGHVDILYQVHGDPGGIVPHWLANFAAKLSVEKTLQNIPAAVARYRGVTSDEVAELPTTGSPWPYDTGASLH